MMFCKTKKKRENQRKRVHEQVDIYVRFDTTGSINKYCMVSTTGTETKQIFFQFNSNVLLTNARKNIPL